VAEPPVPLLRAIGGLKTSFHPLDFAQFSSSTILEKLQSAGVAAAEYFTNLPVSLLWGARMFPFVRTFDRFFADAADGTLPNVSFITPWFGGPFRTDDHPHGDIVLGQRFIEALYTTFVRSPQRPYARPRYVDHNLYDRTSILRFLEWRFLGAPAEGPGRRGGQWYLTKRDRYTNNYGASLRVDKPDPEVDLSGDLTLAPVAPVCDHEDRLEKVGHDDNTHHDAFEPTETLDAIVRQRYDDVSFTPWLRETNVRNVPVVADDRPR
jgi:Phosphoesterase family